MRSRALRALAKLLGLVPILWIGAIAVRSLATRRLASRRVGTEVQLAHMSSVLCIDERVWRGPAPTSEGYHELVRSGITLIVDLRAENEPEHTDRGDGVNPFMQLWLPSPDGRAPDTAHVAMLDNALASESGITYVHCRAGEGRTGALLGAMYVRRGASKLAAAADALAVGSLTFSQLAYIAMAGRFGGIVAALHWLVDWPTERLFDIARRKQRVSG